MSSSTITNPSTSSTQFYTWENYRCAYEIHQSKKSPVTGIPLLLIHPIGVGLSRKFWDRFCQRWYQSNQPNMIYNPDLLGCGESDMPFLAYKPINWANQLQYFLQTVVKQPVIIVVQGALLPVAIELIKQEKELIAGLISSDPTSAPVINKTVSATQQNLLWNLLKSPLGKAFYCYARRRRFLQSFSEKQLFANKESVDEEWLNTLRKGSENIASRYAVFAFLARFWQRNYHDDISAIQQPTLLIVGEKASSVSLEGKQEIPEERLAYYLETLPNPQGVIIKGKNVMPYESTEEFITAISPFVASLG
ncbi:alpha/beta hydrolase [Anabaena sp. FACHB-1237]|uniref:alpha/beta fold hydrolase n=1 Tax=Anabaena sp. FACHB-1237 TaxID=2692769 RepID=UPI0016812E24|nr:alpha/beta hydrolase [Anabaena sp. FACHB-1237]MBD2136374.1 alpha/beta hydrolase [Anabaena sp. FACHB-1237]